MTESVASNGHANYHPRNCKYEPQTASVEGKALVESQPKAGVLTCVPCGLHDFLSSHETTSSTIQLAFYFVGSIATTIYPDNCLQTMLTSRAKEAAQLPTRNTPVCFCNLVTPI